MDLFCAFWTFEIADAFARAVGDPGLLGESLRNVFTLFGHTLPWWERVLCG